MSFLFASKVSPFEALSLRDSVKIKKPLNNERLYCEFLKYLYNSQVFTESNKLFVAGYLQVFF